MTKIVAKIFRNGRNQAVRIPVDLSFDVDTVTIEKRGDALILRPEPRAGWEHFFADETLVMPEDFDTGEDPPPQERSQP